MMEWEKRMQTQARPDPAVGLLEQPRLTLRDWIAAHTFTPDWLDRRWAHPAVGYVVAVLAQCLAALLTLAIDMAFPTLSFRAALLLFVVVLIGLSWGAGPGLLATAAGVVLLNYLVVPPHFTWTYTGGGTIVGIVLFVAVGVAITAVASGAERRRRQAAELAHLLAVESARAEQAQRAATAQAHELEVIFDVIADGILVYDREARLLRSNSAARASNPRLPEADYYERPFSERIARAQPRDAAGHPLRPEDVPVSRILRGEVFTGADAVDSLLLLPDGRERLFNVTGAPIRDGAGRIAGAVIVNRDVTERRRLEQRTQTVLDALLEMAQALVLAPDDLDTAAGHPAQMVGDRLVHLTRQVLGCERISIVAVDPGTGLQHPLAVVGLTPEQEQAWRESAEGISLSEAQRTTAPEHAARFMAGEALVVDLTAPPYRAQPNPFGLRTVLVAPLQVGQTLVGILSYDYGGAEHDYTAQEMALAGAVARLAALTIERERLLHERADAQASALALREANRRMDEFLSIASHELRTPLTGVRGSLQLAQRRARRSIVTEATVDTLCETLDRIDTTLTQADRSVDRLARLTDDLLDVARTHAGTLEVAPTPFDLAAIVREVVETQRQSVPDRRIALDLPAGPLPVHVDADRIAQVLGNYLTNALKYSGAERPVAVQVRLDGDDAWVGVRDEGPGLTAEEQEHIWDRFYRVPRIEVRDVATSSAMGLGLGLYIGRMLIAQHGGRTGVDSVPGAGSTFWFTVPLAAGAD